MGWNVNFLLLWTAFVFNSFERPCASRESDYPNRIITFREEYTTRPASHFRTPRMTWKSIVPFSHQGKHYDDVPSAFSVGTNHPKVRVLCLCSSSPSVVDCGCGYESVNPTSWRMTTEKTGRGNVNPLNPNWSSETLTKIGCLNPSPNPNPRSC